MTAMQPVRRHLIAVIVITFAALIVRSWLQVTLLDDGYQKDYAYDLSYLVVPPILLVFLFPILRQHRPLLKSLLTRRGLTATLVIRAIAIGVLLRLTWWCQMIAGISFGVYGSVDPGAVTGPAFSFGCAAPHVVLLGIAVTAMMVPFVEELIHRGLVQTWLADRGPVIAITLSSLFFMVVHRQPTWLFAFCAGIVFGVLCWRTGTIWLSFIAHATVNGLIQFDWRCVQGQWNPQPSDLPLWSVGLSSTLVLLLAVAALYRLVFGKTAGARAAPRP